MKLTQQILLTLIIAFLFTSVYSEVVDRIVAKVGGDIILESELEEHRSQLQQMGVISYDVSNKDILNDIIESKLILQRAKHKNYQIDDFRLRQQVNSQIEEQISHLGSEEELRNQLRKVGMSLTDLREYYEQIIKEQRLKEMIIESEIRTRVTVSETDLEEYYYDNIEDIPRRPKAVEVGLIRIDILPSEDTKKEVYRSINQIYDRIREGKDFANLAKEFSDCPSSNIGGDLGFFGKGTMLREFEETAFDLKPGEISGIIETVHGYHIIKMEERDHDEIRVRHILKRVTPLESDIKQTLSLANKLRDKLEQSADFNDIAERYSQHHSTAYGGVWGEFTEDEYPEEFREYLVDLQVGDLSQVIKLDNSYYILSKLKSVPGRPYSLDEIRDELREYILTNKQIDQYSVWIKQLIDESYVNIFLDQ